MATISRIFSFFPLRHCQGEAHTHLIVTKGSSTRGGKGYGCWFWPVGTAISEVPLNDQVVSLSLKGKTKDSQEVVVTAQAWYTVNAPETAAGRFDFSLDTNTGSYHSDPLTDISGALTSAAQESVWNYVSTSNLEPLLADGLASLGSELTRALSGLDFGIQVGRVAVMMVRPDSKIESALQAETRERLQMNADAAGFTRRAKATEQERAIDEATMNNQIELARQRLVLIEQNDKNTQREAQAAVENTKIRTEGELAVKARQAEEALRTDTARATELVRLASERAASELATRIESDAQVIVHKIEDLDATLKAEEKRVALFATNDGKAAAAAISRLDLPTALANVRVLGAEGLQLVLRDLE